MLLQFLAQNAGRGEALRSGSAGAKQVCQSDSTPAAIYSFSMARVGCGLILWVPVYLASGSPVYPKSI